MDRLRKSLRIGKLEVPNRVFLAPLAGVSDSPFRRICQERGAGLTFVEMLSASAITMGAHRTMGMVRRHADEPELGVQITGRDAATISTAIRRLAPFPFDVVDLNMGCPVRKVVSSGCGSALLRDAEKIREIVEQANAIASCPVTVKIRLGFSRELITVEENATRIAAAGAAMLTIHGRARSENYKDPVDYAGISVGVRAARMAATEPIILVGNGDILNRDGACKMLKETGCDAIMISRGALGNPWIFEEILGIRDNQPSIEEWRDVVLRHLAYHGEHYDSPRIAPRLFRKHLLWYLSGFPGVRKMREVCSVVGTLEEARRRVTEFAASLPAGTRRHADRA